MRKIFKFTTGAEVPDGSIFLSTIVEEAYEQNSPGGNLGPRKVRYVWHYFLVEVDKDGKVME